MSDFINQYLLYLIKQYYEKPKANAEAKLLISTWGTYADFIANFGSNFDIDNAKGEVLDLIGRIVGLPRQVNEVTPKLFFGFVEADNTSGFWDPLNPAVPKVPFRDDRDPIYTTYQLNDYEYRKFLKIKIAKNNCSPYLSSDEKTSLQQVVFDAFEGNAYVADNKDQTLTIYISPSYSDDEIRLILQLDILPRPITFSYNVLIKAVPGQTFGFSENPNFLGFGDPSNPNVIGGILSDIYVP